MSDSFVFTSESVSEGHPDKISDQISDAILDAILEHDATARVACETLVKTGMVLVAGEITTSAHIDFEAVVRSTVIGIGYTDSSMGFDGHTCAVLNAIGKQSPDIAQGVDRGEAKDQGAGDQGLMFGYATNETDVLMPAPITYSHRLVQQQAKVRKNGKLPWLRPDAKSQVSCVYENSKPVAVDAVVLSSQHHPDVSMKDLREGVMEEIIKPVLPAEWLGKDTKFHINPTGRFEIGGPMGDCGLTGRNAKSSSIPTAARRGMVAALSPEKTRRKSTGPPPMPAVTLPRTSLPPDSQIGWKSKSLTQSALPNRRRSVSRLSGPAKFPTAR